MLSRYVAAYRGLAILAVSLVCTPVLFAQEAGTIDPRIVAVAPFLDADAFMVVHLDLKQLDIRGAVDRLANLAPEEAKEQVANVKTMAAVGVQLKNQLAEAGVAEVFVIATLGTGGEKPGAFAIVPVEKGKDVAAAKMAIEMIPGVKEEQLFIHNGYVVAGPPEIKEYVGKIKPATLAPLTDAFKYSGTTALQVIVLPNKKLAGIAKKNAPPGLPAELPTADEVAEDMKAIVITANLPPKPALAIFGHAKDEAAAKAAADEVKKLLDSDDAKGFLALPALEKLAPFLRPVQDGPRFKVVLTEANGGIEALTTALKVGAEMLAPLAAQGGVPGLPPGGGNRFPK